MAYKQLNPIDKTRMSDDARKGFENKKEKEVTSNHSGPNDFFVFSNDGKVHAHVVQKNSGRNQRKNQDRYIQKQHQPPWQIPQIAQIGFEL